MKAGEVRAAVESFRRNQAVGERVEHCFAPWYLHQVFQLSEAAALERSSDGNYDFGIDGYHYEPGRLLLVQAKFTDTLQQIEKGFRDLEKALEPLARALRGIASEIPNENKVLINLRAALNKLTQEDREAIELEFVVLHLSEEDPAIIAHRTDVARQNLKEAVGNELPRHKGTVKDVGPKQLGQRKDIFAPREYEQLSVTPACEFRAGKHGNMLFGIGRLAELVELFERRRDHLFSKNVRYYLTGRRKEEKGPAGKMRETLEQICVERCLAPEVFGLYHNGVTIYSSKVERTNGEVRVREPYVLNGCQTVKNAYYFKNDDRIKTKIALELWNSISVPLRIVETTSEDIVRTVTVNLNRQNKMSAAAFRANDPIQIELEERFRSIGIIYERQEGALKNIQMDNPELLEEYENSKGLAVRMVDLGRCLAATAGEIAFATHPGDLFESDEAYARCFSESRTRSLSMLVFLQNLEDNMSTVLKMDLGLEQKGKGPRPSKLKYYCICLVMRYLAKKRMGETLTEYGSKLYRDKPQNKFRELLSRLMRERSGGIAEALKKHFMNLDSSDDISDAWERAERSTGLRKEIDPFERLGDVSLEGDAAEELRRAS